MLSCSRILSAFFFRHPQRLSQRWNVIWLALFVGCVAFSTPDQTQATETEPAQESAIVLLRSCVQMRPDSTQNVLLRALRHLRDPALKPFFTELSQSDTLVLKIHGMLGLAECDPNHKLDMSLIASIPEPANQAEAVSAAMDSDLLSTAQAKELLAWPGLDLAVRILISTVLVKEKQFDQFDLLREGLKSDNLGRRCLSALLLTQSGNDAGRDELQNIITTADPKREPIIEMLLSSVMRYNMDRLGTWAMNIATDTHSSARLKLLALPVAIRFKGPGAIESWQEQFQTTTDPANQIRLALVAMNVASWAEPAMFEPFSSVNDPVISAIGKVSVAVASKQPVAEHVVALLKLPQAPAIISDWSLYYVKRSAAEADGPAILNCMIQAYDGPERNRAQRLDNVVSATQLLMEKYPGKVHDLLQPILSDPQANPMLVQAILLGLIRAESKASFATIADLPSPQNIHAHGLWLMLRARSDEPMDAAQLNDLAMLVRGGGVLRDKEALRIQAAWIYLKKTNQTQQALTAILGK